jgi:hypothetical protein
MKNEKRLPKKKTKVKQKELYLTIDGCGSEKVF